MTLMRNWRFIRRFHAVRSNIMNIVTLFHFVPMQFSEIVTCSGIPWSFVVQGVTQPLILEFFTLVLILLGKWNKN